MEKTARSTWPFTVALLVHISASCAAAQSKPVNLEVAIDETVRAAMAETPFPGLVVGIIRDTTILLTKAYGLADVGSGQQMTVAHLFQIGSASKAMTSTLLAVTVERGLIAVSDQAVDYLPDSVAQAVSPGLNPITIEQLASHHSGLPSELSAESATGSSEFRTQTSSDLRRALQTTEVQSEPGTIWQYSNFGYATLGMVLGEVNRLSYEDALMELVLVPLGMDATVIGHSAEFPAGLASTYKFAEASGQVSPAPALDLGAMSAAGGVISSVTDLAKFVALHLEDEGRETGPRMARLGIRCGGLRIFHKARWTSANGKWQYGLGWGGTNLDLVGPVVFHDGGMPGHASYVGFAPGSHIGVVLLTNLGGDTPAPVRELGQKLLQSTSLVLQRTLDLSVDPDDIECGG